MRDKDRCLRAAEECERLARRTASVEDRNTLLNMARLWRELAETAVMAEEAEGGAPAARAHRHS